MELVTIKPGVLSFLVVLDHTVPYIVKTDLKPHVLKAGTDILDIVYRKTIADVYIGLVCKGILGTYRKTFQRKRKILCFRLRLLFQLIIQIPQCRYGIRIVVEPPCT